MPKTRSKSGASADFSKVYRSGTGDAIERLSSPQSKALARTRQGALFSLGSVEPTDRWRYLRPPERRSENAFLDALFDLAAATADRAIDMGSMGERMGLSRPAILKIVAKLLKEGLLTKTTIAYYENRRAVTLYLLVTPDELPPPALPAPDQPSPQLAMPIGDDLLRQAVQLRYDSVLDQYIPWKGERFIVFNLTALLRSGRTGPDSQHIAIELRQGKRYCRAEARATVGKMLAGVLDLRPLIVLLTLVRQHLAKLEGRPAENLFRIYLRDICEAMALEPSSSNVRAIYAQLDRWRHTSYTIVDDMYGMLDWAKDIAEVGRDFSVFAGLDFVTWAGREGVTPELIQISLYEPIYRALLESDRALSVHSQILKDRRPHPLIHKLYYWCRRVVRHQHDEREFLLDHIRSEINPNKQLREFRRDIREALASHAREGEGFRARVPGYLIQYKPFPTRPRYDLLAIAADPRDPIVGEGSAYSKRINQEQSPHEIAGNPTLSDTVSDPKASDARNSLKLQHEFLDPLADQMCNPSGAKPTSLIHKKKSGF